MDFYYKNRITISSLNSLIIFLQMEENKISDKSVKIIFNKEIDNIKKELGKIKWRNTVEKILFNNDEINIEGLINNKIIIDYYNKKGIDIKNEGNQFFKLKGTLINLTKDTKIIEKINKAKTNAELRELWAILER